MWRNYLHLIWGALRGPQTHTEEQRNWLADINRQWSYCVIKAIQMGYIMINMGRKGESRHICPSQHCCQFSTYQNHSSYKVPLQLSWIMGGPWHSDSELFLLYMFLPKRLIFILLVEMPFTPTSRIFSEEPSPIIPFSTILFTLRVT